MRYPRIAFSIPCLLILVASCSGGGGGGGVSTPHDDAGSPEMSTGNFTLAVDDAKLERSIGLIMPAQGNMFVDVGITLTNVSEPTPLPAQFILYSLVSSSSLIYMASIYTPNLQNACPATVSVAAGGHLSCRVAFEITLAEQPTKIQYSDPVGKRMATASISSVEPLPIPPGDMAHFR